MARTSAPPRPIVLVALLASLVGATGARGAGPKPDARTRARATTDTTYAGRPLVGVVYDSLAGAPLAGATVTATALAPTHPDSAPPSWVTTTDSVGRFRFARLPLGRLVVQATHAELDSAGFWAGVADTVSVAEGSRTSAIAVALATPAVTTLAERVCHAAPYAVPAAPGRAMRIVVLYGAVQDAERERALPGTPIRVSWLGTAAGVRSSASAASRTRADGSTARARRAVELVEYAAGTASVAGGAWSLCLYGAAAELDDFEVAVGDTARVASVPVRVGTGGVRRVDLVAAPVRTSDGADELPSSVAAIDAPHERTPAASSSEASPRQARRDAAAGTPGSGDPAREAVARAANIVRWLPGVVRDSAGRPVPGVRVWLSADTLRMARTDSLGRFRLAVPWLGNHVVLARALGYAAYEARLAIAARSPVTLDLTLGRLTVLSRVEVRDLRAEQFRLRRIEEIAYNRERGLGVVIDSTVLARYNYDYGAAFAFTGRKLPYRSPARRAWGGANGGLPCLVVDDVRQALGTMPPFAQQVAVVEVYAATGAPARYVEACGGAGTYGITVIWTRAFVRPRVPTPVLQVGR